MPRPQTVFLVAKDHLTRNVTSTGLSKYGYEVLTAECADRATDILLSKNAVGVLVIDLHLVAATNGLGVAGPAQKTKPTHGPYLHVSGTSSRLARRKREMRLSFGILTSPTSSPASSRC